MLLKVRQGCDFTQDGKTYRAGDLVEVPEKYVVVLTLPGGRLQHPDAPAGSRGDLQRADLQAGDGNASPLGNAGQAPGRGRRQYQRRDLEAKD